MAQLIAAVARNRVIGNNGQLPWHIPEDLRYFKHTTMGHALLMGRKTYASIGRPLPGRRMLVLSRNTATIPGVTVYTSLQDALREYPNAFVIGGAEIYAQSLPHVSKLFLTEIDREFEGDTFFPAWDPQAWTRIESIPGQNCAELGFNYRFCVYTPKV